MRIMVISDVHANADAFRIVLDDITHQRYDDLFFLGDLFINGPEPENVYDMLDELHPSIWLQGNTDAWFAEIGSDDWKPASKMDVYFKSLHDYAKERLTAGKIMAVCARPAQQSIERSGVRILCVHGSPRSISEAVGPDLCDTELNFMLSSLEETILLCGHSHKPWIHEDGTRLVLNSGSVGFCLDGDPRASYGILDLSQEKPTCTIRRLKYDNGLVVKKLKENHFPITSRLESFILNARMPS